MDVTIENETKKVLLQINNWVLARRDLLELAGVDLKNYEIGRHVVGFSLFDALNASDWLVQTMGPVLAGLQRSYREATPEYWGRLLDPQYADTYKALPEYINLKRRLKLLKVISRASERPELFKWRRRVVIARKHTRSVVLSLKHKQAEATARGTANIETGNTPGSLP